jgi:hypothetical protein
LVNAKGALTHQVIVLLLAKMIAARFATGMAECQLAQRKKP